MPEPWIDKTFDDDMERANLVPLPGIRGQWFGQFVSQVTNQDHIVVVKVQRPKRGFRNFAFEVDIDGGREQRIGTGRFEELKAAVDLALLNIDIQLWREGLADKPDRFTAQPKVRFQ